MRHPSLLLIEDDELASQLICEYLQECDFNVSSVFTATDGIAHVQNNKFDIVILDINLPDFDGYEVLKKLKQTVTIPIIITSAYSDTKSKLLAFKYGASDYMIKPLDLEELEARIWLQLGKNSQIKTAEEKSLFAFENGKIFFKNRLLDLTATEFDILSLLLENKNQVIRREDLLGALSSLSSDRALDNHIKNIRKKIGDNGNRAQILKTEYGLGYRLYV